ncbi:RidA family protein [Puniceicoccaceae bacterium K14]|nr:RidA family protein [Puniceicoccaceae bacterium K14]
MRYIIGFLVVVALSGISLWAEEEDLLFRDHYQAGGWENELGYSQAVKVGNVIFISGTRAPGKNMETQMKTIYMRLQSVLGRYGATMNDVTQERIYTTDLAMLKSLSRERKRFYNSGIYPAVSWVQVEALADEAALLEIELVVVID